MSQSRRGGREEPSRYRSGDRVLQAQEATCASVLGQDCKETGVAKAKRARGSRWEFRPAGWTVEVTFLISANLSFLTYKIEQ